MLVKQEILIFEFNKNNVDVTARNNNLGVNKVNEVEIGSNTRKTNNKALDVENGMFFRLLFFFPFLLFSIMIFL